MRGLAVRLLLGEIVTRFDHAGSQWRASATELVLVSRETGERVVIVAGDAFDIAARLATIR